MEQFANDLLESVRQMKAGKAAWVTHVEVQALVEARNRAGLTQAQDEVFLKSAESQR